MTRTSKPAFASLVLAIVANSAAPADGGEGAQGVPGLTPFHPPAFTVVSDEPAVRDHVPGPAAPGEILFDDGFDAIDRTTWFELVLGSENTDAELQTRIVPAWERERGLALIAPGSGGLHATLEATREDAVVVTARLRSFGSGSPALFLVRQTDAGGAALPDASQEVPATGDFVEVRLYLDRLRRRRSLALDFIPGDGVLVLDRVEARFLRPVEREWLIPGAEPGGPPPAARARVNITSMDMEAEGCLVPTGGAVSWRAAVPAKSPRLDLYVSTFGGDTGGELRWTVEVDGHALAQKSDSVGDGAWNSPFDSWVVPLQGFAGRDVTIELRCDGDRSVVGFAGAPRVLGVAPADAPPNVLLISIDTLRRDRVGPRAGAPSLTPRLDALAARGTAFTDACSVSSWTLPSHASLFSGQHPLVHGAVQFDSTLDPVRSPLLTRRFQDAGYSTAAFTAGGYVDPHFGFSDGMEVYSVRDPCGFSRQTIDRWFSYLPSVPDDAAVGATSDAAFDWLRRHADGRFFLFLHTYVVHDYDDAKAITPELQRDTLMARANAGDADALHELIRRYENSVAEVDGTLVGRTLDLLKELAIDERTIVAVVSDHGEEFGERGRVGHGKAITNEVSSIVMVLAGPGVPPGNRVDKRVSLMDVSGTLARLVGLPADPNWRGVDLFAPPPDDPRALILDLGCDEKHFVSLWLGDWQVTRTYGDDGAPISTLFERRDPATGTAPAVEPTPAQREALERRFDAEVGERLERAAAAPGKARVPLPDALRERLKQLGYGNH